MTRKGSTARQISRGAHIVSRSAGDVAAWQSGGPKRYLKRRVRRGLVSRIMRAIGNLDK